MQTAQRTTNQVFQKDHTINLYPGFFTIIISSLLVNVESIIVFSFMLALKYST